MARGSIGYDKFTEAAPPAMDRDERDQWMIDRDIDVIDLLRVGNELATFRLQALADGDQIGESELTLALQSAMLFGFELAMRVMEQEGLVTRDA